MPDLDPEDAKILTLARVAMQRAYAPHAGPGEGAAVRDTDGRTYAAATVENSDERLTTSAVRGAVAAAASSGARSFEAVALVTSRGSACADDLAVVAEFGPGTHVIVAGVDGEVRSRFTVGEALGGRGPA
ncbi:MAG: cytidine deaminase [Frankiaceae bacterium]